MLGHLNPRMQADKPREAVDTRNRTKRNTWVALSREVKVFLCKNMEINFSYDNIGESTKLCKGNRSFCYEHQRGHRCCEI